MDASSGRARRGSSARVYEQIDHLERVPIRTQSYVRYVEQFRWPLACAIAALILELGLFAWKGPLT